jgi:hypothetical protein
MLEVLFNAHLSTGINDFTYNSYSFVFLLCVQNQKLNKIKRSGKLQEIKIIKNGKVQFISGTELGDFFFSKVEVKHEGAVRRKINEIKIERGEKIES